MNNVHFACGTRSTCHDTGCLDAGASRDHGARASRRAALEGVMLATYAAPSALRSSSAPLIPSASASPRNTRNVGDFSPRSNWLM